MQDNSKEIDNLFIETKSRHYPVYLGKNAINKLALFLKEQYPHTKKIAIITDENVVIHLESLKEQLIHYSTCIKIVPPGEKAKTFDIYYECQTFALENHLDRNSIILAFGGGAVGDLAGFVASTFMRGIPFIQIPTTILAHDSAIGGKVAINHPLGKNLIGTFYQPVAVFYDLNFLSTLEKREKLSGLAEIIKEALISDDTFYQLLVDHVKDVDAISTTQLQQFLKRGMLIKEQIVSRDEKEENIRAFLNFGHTLGHALEVLVGYGKWTHGQAVIVGMIFALKISNEIYHLNFPLEPFKNWLQELGFEVCIPCNLSTEQLIDQMFLDKKAFGNKVNFVLLKEIGQPILHPFTKEQLTTIIEKI